MIHKSHPAERKKIATKIDISIRELIILWKLFSKKSTLFNFFSLVVEEVLTKKLMFFNKKINNEPSKHYVEYFFRF